MPATGFSPLASLVYIGAISLPSEGEWIPGSTPDASSVCDLLQHDNRRRGLSQCVIASGRRERGNPAPANPLRKSFARPPEAGYSE